MYKQSYQTYQMPSEKNVQYVQVEKDLLFSDKIPGELKLVYITILAHWNQETGLCFPSIKGALCKETGLSRNTLSKRIDALESIGLLKRVHIGRLVHFSIMSFSDMLKFETCANSVHQVRKFCAPGAQILSTNYNNITRIKNKNKYIEHFENLKIEENKQTREAKKDILIKSTYSLQIEELYKNEYPLKKGKTKGLAKLSSQIKTEQDLSDLKMSIQNYKQSSEVKNGFIKHFSTFAADWRDWLENDLTSESNWQNDFIKRHKLDNKI
jgi:hypothetical protein